MQDHLAKVVAPGTNAPDAVCQKVEQAIEGTELLARIAPDKLAHVYVQQLKELRWRKIVKGVHKCKVVYQKINIQGRKATHQSDKEDDAGHKKRSCGHFQSHGPAGPAPGFENLKSPKPSAREHGDKQSRFFPECK